MSGFYSLVPRVLDGQHSRMSWLPRFRYPGVEEGGKLCRFQKEQALIWTPHQLVGPGIITLGGGRTERVGSLARTALVDRLAGRSLGATASVEQVIRDMALNPPRDSNGVPAWNPVIARKDGRRNIWIGPPEDRLLYGDRIAIRGPNSKDVQDVFTRANGALDNSTTSDAQTTWNLAQGSTANAQIVSNQLQLNGDSDEFVVAILDLDMDTTDHYAQLDLSSYTWTSGQIAVGVIARIRFGTGAAGEEGYGFEILKDGASTGSRRIYDFETDANLSGGDDTTLTASGTLQLECDGTDITAKIGGVDLFGGPITDSTHGTFEKTGVTGFRSGTASSTTDNFRAADLVVAASAAITGTAGDGCGEADIVAGGQTVIITLTNDTWVASGATFDAQRQNIIDGLDSAQSEVAGWNAEVRDSEVVTAVVRTSDTVVTITLTAAASYAITANETITVTVPGSAVTGGSPITASPTFVVTATASGTILPIIQHHLSQLWDQ